MPKMNWFDLSAMQLGKYAEYYAKMEFASYGFDVYTSEVDDHGVDFVAKAPKEKVFYEVQVKSVRDYKYTYISKGKMPELSDDRLVCYIHFIENNQLPDVFVIPASAWKTPNAVLVEYGKEDDGKGEWGINISRKNYAILNEYCIETWMNNIGEKNDG